MVQDVSPYWSSLPFGRCLRFDAAILPHNDMRVPLLNLSRRTDFVLGLNSTWLQNGTLSSYPTAESGTFDCDPFLLSRQGKGALAFGMGLENEG